MLSIGAVVIAITGLAAVCLPVSWLVRCVKNGGHCKVINQLFPSYHFTVLMIFFRAHGVAQNHLPNTAAVEKPLKVSATTSLIKYLTCSPSLDRLIALDRLATSPINLDSSAWCASSGSPNLSVFIFCLWINFFKCWKICQMLRSLLSDN